MKKKKWGKWIAVWVVALVVAVSPIGQWMDFSNGEVDRVEAAGLLDLSLIGGVNPTVQIHDGILKVSLKGQSVLKLGALKTYFIHLRLPANLGFLLRQEGIEQHMWLDYKIPGLLFPITGKVPGKNLTIEQEYNLVEGRIVSAIELGLLNNVEFTFNIDLNGLGVSIPPGKYTTQFVVSNTLLDVGLLINEPNILAAAFTIDGGHTETDVLVTILPQDSAPPKVEEPSDPPTGDVGALTLDQVPFLHFGTQQITEASAKYYAESLQPFIQVTDWRGTGQGWNVTAQLETFSSRGQNTLPAAILRLYNGEVSSSHSGFSSMILPPSPIELRAGGDAASVVQASQGKGLGTWTTRWLPTGNSELNDNVTLEIPGGSASPGTHSANITWTLIDAP